MQYPIFTDTALIAGIKTSSTEDGVVTMVMDRPDQRNAMSSESVDRLMHLFDLLSGSADCRCIILVGAGRGFCAGSDLKELSHMNDQKRSQFEHDCGRLSRMIARLPRPVIAAVHGFAVGGGLTLAASCDAVITAPDARWSLPEVPIGLFPAWGLACVVRRCGIAAARRLTWGIDTLSGTRAVETGLADDVADDPLAEALALGRKLAALPPEQAACVKEYFSFELNAEESDQFANRLFMRMSRSPEASATLGRQGHGPGQ